MKCKLCDNTSAGLTTRMTAHFAKKSGYHEAKCTKDTAGATALGKRYMSDLHGKRENT